MGLRMVKKAEMRRQEERDRKRETEERGWGQRKTGKGTSVLHGTLADVMQCEWTHCHISPGRTINMILNNNS